MPYTFPWFVCIITIVGVALILFLVVWGMYERRKSR